MVPVSVIRKALSSRVKSSFVWVTLVDEGIMPINLQHTLSLISLIAVYAPTQILKLEEKEMFCGRFGSAAD